MEGALSESCKEEAPENQEDENERDGEGPTELRTILLVLLCTRGVIDKGAAELVGVVLFLACRRFALLALYLIYQLLQTVVRLVCVDAYAAETTRFSGGE